MLRSILTLGASSSWMVVGRLSGLVWTLLLVSFLGVGDYGLYATAYAAAAILSAPIENIFVVRCVRVGEGEYLSDRSLRAVIGALVALAGAALYPVSFVAGFALLVAGLEMLFNAFKSVAVRAGRPGLTMRADAIRQITSILVATGYLLTHGDAATLEAACLWYLSPYAVVVLLAARLCLGHRPGGPRQWRDYLVLVLDALVLSVYLQGDIILLGLLASSEVVGVYSIASQLALAASTVGQLFGQQYAARLRDDDGAAEAGPPRALTVGLGAVLFLGALAIAVALLTLTEHHEVGWALLAIAPFAGLRSMTNTWVVVLYVRRADVPRIAWSAVALAIRYSLVLVLAGVVAESTVGTAVATALAAVAGEAVLVAGFSHLMTRTRARTAD